MAKDDTIEAVKKKRRGRMSRFKPEYTEQVEKLCRLGYTDKDLALFFNVSVNTIDNWKKRYPDFFAALHRGKLEADTNVAEALQKNAIGYEYYENHPVKLKAEISRRLGQGQNRGVCRGRPSEKALQAGHHGSDLPPQEPAA